MVQVFVPPNVQSGQQRVQTEAGPLVEVPPGVDPGTTLEVQMPGGDPLPQATPTLLSRARYDIARIRRCTALFASKSTAWQRRRHRRRRPSMRWCSRYVTLSAMWDNRHPANLQLTTIEGRACWYPY